MDYSMNFSDILASTLHDTKNSLGVLFNNLETIIAHCREQNCAGHAEFYTLQYEIQRLNSSLIRLLSLYKAEKSQLAVNIDYHSIGDLLEDTAAAHEILLGSRGIRITTRCPDGLYWAFDRQLVGGVLDNVINNAFRYAQAGVTLAASVSNGYLALQVEDDGRGYPAAMLINEDGRPGLQTNVDFQTGSTGLGLYFALMVAGLHVHQEKKGFISICNGKEPGGGVFSMYLP
jgi:K+-sensing histidine kinase KdpD